MDKKQQYKDHPKTLLRGDVRSDGMVFYRYHITAKGFEHWMTPDKFKSYNSRYLKRDTERRKNPEIAKSRREAHNDRYQNDEMFKLKSNTRARLTVAHARSGYSKSSKTHELLDCSYDDLKFHLESQFTDGMTWDNQGDWHVDHRLPLSAAKTQEEFIVLNHHRNLQPMWAHDNLSKGDKHCPKELKKYLTKYL